jgi:serine/threonine protein kinase
MKVIPLNSIEESNELMKQTSIILKLKHQNLVEYLEFYIDLKEEREEIFFITIMPLYKMDLEKYLSIYETNFNEKIKILLQVLEGIEYLHKNEIIHRDIKLENIFLEFNKNEEVIIKLGKLKFFNINIKKNNKNKLLKNNNNNI